MNTYIVLFNNISYSGFSNTVIRKKNKYCEFFRKSNKNKFKDEQFVIKSIIKNKSLIFCVKWGTINLSDNRHCLLHLSNTILNDIIPLKLWANSKIKYLSQSAGIFLVLCYVFIYQLKINQGNIRLGLNKPVSL
jgi:hypothetical protein